MSLKKSEKQRIGAKDQKIVSPRAYLSHRYTSRKYIYRVEFITGVLTC